MPGVSQAALTAENQFCPPLPLEGWAPHCGCRPFDLAVWGEFRGSLSVQMSYDQGHSWLDTGDCYEAPLIDRGHTATPCLIRCGFKPGDHLSGTAHVRIAQ